MNDKNTSKKKILLAEDDDSMRRLLEVTLRRAGYEVVSTEDGLAALELVLADGFDAIVTDDVMPNMTGHDLCRMLRQNEQKKDVPMIILSGMDKFGADDYNDCAPDAHLLKDNKLKENLTKTLKDILN